MNSRNTPEEKTIVYIHTIQYELCVHFFKDKICTNTKYTKLELFNNRQTSKVLLPLEAWMRWLVNPLATSP